MRDASTTDSPRLAAARASLSAARAARARGASPDTEELRGAYLDLLKLCLCDLASASTVSVGRGQDGSVWSRELHGDEVRWRSAGMDWPLTGLTMVGLARLDDLQTCVESVVRDGVEGDLIEVGAWRGGASILMRATLDSLGGDDRTVFVADSFQGFPPGGDFDPELGDLSVFDFLAVPVEEVKENFARLGYERGVAFVPGFFQETLPGLTGRRWSLIRLDGDTYDATRLALECLYPGLSVGGHLVVDDYGSLDECRRAVDEFRAEHGIAEPLREVDFTGARWRRESDAPLEVPARDGARAHANGAGAPRAVARSGDGHVPSIHELTLARENEELRARLGAADAELGQLRASPLRAPRRWLRRRIGRAG
jgi:Macrocin-O-methyltransferase (TylF)